MDTRQKQQEEVDNNFKAFEDMLPDLLKKYGGGDKYALMKNCEVVTVFDTDQDALRAGEQLFKDGIFSVQKIAREKIDLGFLSTLACPVSLAK